MQIYFYTRTQRLRINSTQFIDVGMMPNMIRRYYRMMRNNGMRPYQARSVIANMLFIGTSYQTQFRSK